MADPDVLGSRIASRARAALQKSRPFIGGPAVGGIRPGAIGTTVDDRNPASPNILIHYHHWYMRSCRMSFINSMDRMDTGVCMGLFCGPRNVLFWIHVASLDSDGV